MSGLFFTIIAAAILITLAFIGLAISLILTGKSRLNRFTCGWNPNNKRNKECGKEHSCTLCSPPKEETKEKKKESEND